MGPIWKGLILSGASGVLLGLALVIGGMGPSHAAPAGSMLSQDASAERGRALFNLYCVACHRLDGVPLATGAVGPDLTAFKSQGLIAGAVPNTPENLARYLANPATVKRDTMMPPLGLSSAQISDLVAFLLPPPPTAEEPSGEPTLELPESPPASAD